jgi:hypothetical protein
VDPYALAFGPNNDLYVAGQGGVSVRVFDTSGDSLYPFGGYGTGNGQFSDATGLALDSCGNIFVVDSTNYRIEKFNPCGSTCVIPVPPTATFTNTATPTVTTTFTTTTTPTVTVTNTVTFSPSLTLTRTPTYTATFTFTPTFTYTFSNTPTRTYTFTPTFTKTPTVTFTPTVNPNYGITWALATGNAAFGARGGHSAVTFNNGTTNQMYVLGGTNGAVTFSDVWSSSNGVTWNSLISNAPWGPRTGQASVVFNGKIWVIGGMGPNGDENDVWSSPDGIHWTQMTANAAFQARDSHSVVAFNNGNGLMLFLIGGSSNGSILNDVWDSSDGINWTQVTFNAVFYPREDFESVIYNNQIWVIGGQSAYSPLSDVWSSPDGLNWTVSTSVAPFLPRGGSSGIVVNGNIWLMAGETISAYQTPDLNDVWYSSNGSTWTEATASAGFGARDSQATVSFANDMWVIGGFYRSTYQGPVSAYGDVWYSPSASGAAAANARLKGSAETATPLSAEKTITATPTVTSTEVFTATPTPAVLIQSVMAAPNISYGQQPIQFKVGLGRAARIQLILFSISGEVVYQASAQGNPGMNSLVWGMENRVGRVVASGLYIYVLQVDDGVHQEVQKGKVVVIR